MNLVTAALIAELAVLFVGLPLLIRLLPVRISPLPVLWMAAVYALSMLRRTPGFDPHRLWNGGALSYSLGSVLELFAIAAVILTIVVWRVRPQLLFGLVRASPRFWALLMVLYPVFSVYPQGIVYRTFFFARYRALFPSPGAMILASAGAFAFSHIVFRNPWSVGLTFLAGVLFGWRYFATGSLLVSSLEHALYGCFMFTVGLGELFHHGAGRPALRR